MIKSFCLARAQKPYPQKFQGIFGRLLIATIVLSSISVTTTYASFDESDYFSEFVPAIDIHNDTRNNLIMLLSQNPPLLQNQASLSFDQSEINCNLLQANILADFWGAKTPRWCNDWQDNQDKRNFYRSLFVVGKQTSPYNATSATTENPFVNLPSADQTLINGYLIPLFSQAESSDFASDKYGEGFTNPDFSISNNIKSLIQFFNAVNSAQSLLEEEKVTLKKARLALYAQFKTKNIPQFASEPAFQALPEIGQVSEFKQYLIAAEAFYGQDFSKADAIFTGLTQAENSWIAETAQYMLIRTALNRVGTYEDYWQLKPSSLNQTFVNKTLEAINSYQAKYPNGKYIESANALVRRIYWYSGQYDELETAYENTLTEHFELNTQTTDPLSHNLELMRLIDEVDIKLLEEHADIDPQKPILAFIQYLKDLRQEKPARFEGKDNKTIEAEVEIIAQGLTKIGLADAAQYLRLLTNWRLEQNASVLAQFPTFDDINDKLHDPSIFAMQILRSDILRKIGENNALVELWQTIITSPNITLTQQQYAQLQLAGAYIANNQVEKIFATDSPIINLYYREAVLNQTLNNEVLRTQAISGKNLRERRIALLALFKNYLHQENFKDMAKDLALITPIMSDDPQKSYPEDYPYQLRDSSVVELTPFQGLGWAKGTEEYGHYECPNVQIIFDRLAQNGKQDAQATLCLGDFLLENYSNNFYYWHDLIHKELLSDGIQTYRTFNRGQLYDSVLKNPNASYDEKAYALFRKINCYATSGNNGCGDKDVELIERKRWFNQLKKSYSKSIWAQNLKYYW